MSYDELKEVLERFVNGGAQAAPSARTVTNKSDESWGNDEVESPSASKSKAAPRKTAASVEDEFDKAFSSK